MTARALLALGVAAYLYVVGATALPAVHYFYDAVAIRDAGTVWRSLSWSVADEKHFLPAAVMNHIEGPLQFVFLNAYYHAVGDLFPLNPRTTQFPNTVLSLLAAFVAYRLGRRLDSDRFGVGFALAFALMPWLGVTIRNPWVFNTASCLLHLVTFSAYARWMLEPDRRVSRIGAPAALAAYLTTGLDWPAVLAVLALFLLLNGRLRDGLRNPYNVLPGLVMLLYAAWTVSLFLYGRYVHTGRAHLYQWTVLVYPFFKVGVAPAAPPLGKIAAYVRDTFGITLVLALAGALLAWLPGGFARAADVRARARRAFIISMTVWAVAAVVPLLKLSQSVTYGYVAAVPLVALAAVVLARLRPALLAAAVVLMVGLQISDVVRGVDAPRNPDDRRVLAAATFLIERRSDLLSPEKTAFLPRNEASNVGQYARGKNQRIIMPARFPVEMSLHSVGSPEDVLLEFVNAYTMRGTIKADWLILSSETLAEANPAAEFYRSLYADSQISWIAVFRDRAGRALWLGEVKPDGISRERAPVYDVDPLADVYESKYDRISFLERNVKYVHHY